MYALCLLESVRAAGKWASCGSGSVAVLLARSGVATDPPAYHCPTSTNESFSSSLFVYVYNDYDASTTWLCVLSSQAASAAHKKEFSNLLSDPKVQPFKLRVLERPGNYDEVRRRETGRPSALWVYANECQV